MMNQIIEWSKDNPGAMMFLMKVIEPINAIHAIPIITKLTVCTTIRGTNLYVLYSDLGQKNISTIALICKNCPDNVLEDACSRQDYSGVDLIRKYLIDEKAVVRD
jgi:hypothetical protein